MDSLTQAALGAAVAEATFGGKRLGNKAILWGVAFGTLPDLDVLAYPFLDTVSRLEWHRGPSHSLALMLLASPFLGWGLARIHRGKVSVPRASLGIFLILLTHALIDVFTVYGTMIWIPFSDSRVSTNNLFIIDPLFTLPLIVGLVGAWFSRSDSRRRRTLNSWGLILASTYTLWSFAAKAIAHPRLDASFRNANLTDYRMMSAPTPLNTLVWRGLAETDDAFWVTYFSLLHPGTTGELQRIPKNHDLLNGIGMQRELSALHWFSNGYFSAELIDDGVIIRDWRFGEVPSTTSDRPEAIFSWKVTPSPEGPTVEQLPIQRLR